jgi:O-antigen/teichoic acid export membrane protein
MFIARKIAYNVIVASVSKILSTILALVSIGLITRYLGASGFGQYATVLAFLSFFSAISDLGLYSTATRKISRPNADESLIMGKVFPLRIVASLLVVILAPIVVFFFPYPVEVKSAIIIISFSFLFSSSYQILNGVFQKNLAMDKVAITELFGKALQVLFIYFAIKLNLSFNWIIASILLNSFFSFLLIFLLSKKYIRFKINFDFEYWKKFLAVSYPLGLSAIIGFVYFKIDTILLSVMKTSADVGIYNAAYKVIENITFFPAMIIGLIFPIMSSRIFSDKKGFEEISNKTFKVFTLIVAPLIIGTLFLADGIISLIGGAGFSESVLVLKILIFALAAIFFSNFFNAILISANKQKKLLLIMFLAAVFNVTTNLIFIPAYSYLAAAVTSVLTELFVVFSTLFIIRKEVGYFPKIEKFWSILIASLMMAVWFHYFSFLNFFLLAFSGSFVYLFFLWLTKGIRADEISSIIGKKNN